MDDQTISEITRRNIIDALILNKINWSGRLDEPAFLSRLYDLKKMATTDHRFSDAAGDIWQHRVNNYDWSDDWVFYDRRFNLLHASDEDSLRFLCETLHPVVRPDIEEVERIRVILNEHLVKDGWEIREQIRTSGHPIFAPVRAIASDAHTIEAAKIVSQTINAEYVSKQITRMQSALESDTEAAIGTAKEFVETICKTILKERNISYKPNEDMPKLVKQVAGALELVPKDIIKEAKAAEIIKRLLSNLGTVSDGLAELRNIHGTGHGKEALSKGLLLRHARLAVGAATTLAVFLWETHKE